MSATIALRNRQFRKFTALKGWATDTAIAAAIGYDRGNLSRVLQGTQAPGAKFIAGCLTAFPELEFADLFEVLPTDGSAGAAGSAGSAGAVGGRRET